MKQKRKLGRKLLSFLLTLVMVAGLMPGMSLTACAATDTYTNLIPTGSDTDLSAKQVNFNGYKWYIIADNSTAANAGSVTLFAADKIGTSKFYTSSKVATVQSYNGSTVKAYLDSLTTGAGSFSTFADAIIPTNLTTYKFNSNEVYETTENAKLYLLSVSEASELPTNVRKSSETHWWLRSPGTYDQYDNEYYAALVSYATGEVDKSGNRVSVSRGVRPALRLDLSKVVFDSATKTFSLPVSYPSGSAVCR